ncbi:hypothetical protein Nmel_012634, partial [Mimus melanotis]
MDMLANSFAAAVRLRVHCFNCGQQGHVKVNCPKKSASQKKAQGQGSGKPKTECSGGRHEDRSTASTPGTSLCDQLTARTRESAGPDVNTSTTVTIDSLEVHRAPLEAQGPIGKGLSALLLGRPSATLQRIFVHPGVIHADFTGQIYAMVSTPPPVTIPEKTRIAQLILFKS